MIYGVFSAEMSSVDKVVTIRTGLKKEVNGHSSTLSQNSSKRWYHALCCCDDGHFWVVLSFYLSAVVNNQKI